MSLNDDESFIILDGLYAEIWNLIDGKSTWGKIFNTHSLPRDNALLIYKGISAILINKDFLKISSTKRDKNRSASRHGKKNKAYCFGGIEIIEIKNSHSIYESEHVADINVQTWYDPGSAPPGQGDWSDDGSDSGSHGNPSDSGDAHGNDSASD